MKQLFDFALALIAAGSPAPEAMVVIAVALRIVGSIRLKLDTRDFLTFSSWAHK